MAPAKCGSDYGEFPLERLMNAAPSKWFALRFFSQSRAHLNCPDGRFISRWSHFNIRCYTLTPIRWADRIFTRVPLAGRRVSFVGALDVHIFAVSFRAHFHSSPEYSEHRLRPTNNRKINNNNKKHSHTKQKTNSQAHKFAGAMELEDVDTNGK